MRQADSEARNQVSRTVGRNPRHLALYGTSARHDDTLEPVLAAWQITPPWQKVFRSVSFVEIGRWRACT